MKVDWRNVVTARSASVGFVVTAVIAGVSWLGLQVEKSAIVYNCPH